MPEKIIGLALYEGNFVNIYGSYKSEEKGHCVEISKIDGNPFQIGNKVSGRISVSIWKLEFKDKEAAHDIFISCFKYGIKRASKIDKRKKIAAQLKLTNQKSGAVAA